MNKHSVPFSKGWETYEFKEYKNISVNLFDDQDNQAWNPVPTQDREFRLCRISSGKSLTSQQTAATTNPDGWEGLWFPELPIYII